MRNMNLPGITPRSEQDLTALVNQFGDGVAAYIYGYPLVIFGITEQLSANTKPTSTSGSAPLNQFGKQTEFPDSSFTAVVLPSTSTLYASAFLNLKEEPIILHIPDFGNRYFVMPLLDGWTNVNPNSPGTRLGSQEGDYVIVGPDYEGDSQEFRGMTVLRMDTDSVWIIGRVFTHGTKKDLKYVKDKLYPKLTLTPWSKRRDKHYIPPQNLPIDPLVDHSVSPVAQLQYADAPAFFGKLSAMMNDNPASPPDPAMRQALESIGFHFDNGSVSFAYNALPPEDQRRLQAATVAARRFLYQSVSSGGEDNYWTVITDRHLGNYGRHYLQRAEIACWALGANLVKEVVYGYATQASDGSKLSGQNNYTLEFDPLPPVKRRGFWSVTIYAADGTLVDNPEARKAGVNYSAIGQPYVQAHRGVPNADGKGMTLYFQAKPPKDRKSDAFHNWIPTPPPQPGNAEGSQDFIVFLRMYMPKKSIIRGRWKPNGIVRVN